MSEITLALVGDGVQGRRDMLESFLPAGFRIVMHGLEDCVPARAAIGMPGALVWKQALPNLRFLQLPGAGLDGLVPANLPAGCRVANVYEHEGSVAEYVFAALFQLQAGWLMDSHQAWRQGRWPYFDRIGQGVRPSLCGKTLGLVGFGHIGRRCAEGARAFNMDAVVFTRTRPDEATTKAFPQVRFLDSLEAAAAASDVFLVACPHTPETRGLVGRRVIESLPAHAVLVNPGRAEIVDETALFEALSNKKIAGAVLDVWYRYPSSADERITGSRLAFHELDNVITTPHLSANTRDMVTRRWRFMADNLVRFMTGEPIENPVDA